jgi:hypothetical protein
LSYSSSTGPRCLERPSIKRSIIRNATSNEKVGQF